MRVQETGLSKEIVDYYEQLGITELYPPQADAIKSGLLEGRNILAAIPTASGKTLLAEFAMLRSILAGGKALYIVPLRALASEKYEQFSKFRDMIGGRKLRVGISTGDFDERDERLGVNDIIVATSEKVDSLLRNRTEWVDRITVVVADEIHLLDSPDRGPTLEITLAKLMQVAGSAQFIALSATVGNAEEVAKWLGAECIKSDWRPVDLREGVFYGNAITFTDGQREVKKAHRDAMIALAIDTIAEGGQCLVFEGSRRNAESSARRIGDAVGKLLGRDGRSTLAGIAEEIRDTGESEIARRLAECVDKGTAFHHAGLISEHRKLVEDGFRSGAIKVVSSTPTLAAGLNLPARRVIIRGYRRYDPNLGMVPIPVLEYKQMAGRAGRPRLDPYGESVLLAKTFDELEELMREYVLADVEKIWSKLGSENALRTHILSTIATGFANTREELDRFMGTTFYACQQAQLMLEAIINKVLGFLETEGMISTADGLHATKLGSLVSLLYIDPLSASMMLHGLDDMHKAQVTALTLLDLICKTPDIRRIYLRADDYDWIGEIVAHHSNEFVHIPRESDRVYEWFLSEVKTALLIREWVEESHEDDITNRFGVGPGDIRALADTAQWLMHSLAELSAFKRTEYTDDSRELGMRIEYGARAELLDLIKLRGIGRVRARNLYNAGYHDTEALRYAGFDHIAKIVGTKTAKKALAQLGIHVD